MTERIGFGLGGLDAPMACHLAKVSCYFTTLDLDFGCALPVTHANVLNRAQP